LQLGIVFLPSTSRTRPAILLAVWEFLPGSISTYLGGIKFKGLKTPSSPQIPTETAAVCDSEWDDSVVPDLH
jgi:hypothetical protein